MFGHNNLLSNGTQIGATVHFGDAELERGAAGDASVAKLSELAELHRRGDLNDDEFTAAKRQILGS